MVIDPVTNVLVHDVQYTADTACNSVNITGVVNDYMTGFCYHNKATQQNMVLTAGQSAPGGGEPVIFKSVYDQQNVNCSGPPISQETVWAPISQCTLSGMADGSDHVFTLASDQNTK